VGEMAPSVEAVCLPDVVSAGLEKDFLSRLGCSKSDLKELQPGQLAVSLWPLRSERVSMCLLRSSVKDVDIPRSGWYEGEVTLQQRKRDNCKWVNIRWSSLQHVGGKARTTPINIRKVMWCPSYQLDPAAELAANDASGQSASSTKPGLEEDTRTGISGAWLNSATQGCLPAFHHNASKQVFLQKWWTEARQGVVRLSLTPSLVAAELREFHEVRHFLTVRAQDVRLWTAINASGRNLASLDLPPALLSAIRQAKHRGAKYISPSGVFVAPSMVCPGELGLYSLQLFYPSEILGVFAGQWLWERGKGIFTRSRAADEEARPLSDFPNSDAIHKYGMRFQNTDIIDGVKTEVTAVIDPCHGAKTLTVKQVRELDEPFGLMNEPGVGQSANCEVQSRINVLEPTDDEDRYNLLVVSTLPLLPCAELLIHYGQKYDRSYAVGRKSPTLFTALPVGSSCGGEFGIGSLGRWQHSLAETSTDVPSTPCSMVSSASSSSPPIVDTPRKEVQPAKRKGRPPLARGKQSPAPLPAAVDATDQRQTNGYSAKRRRTSRGSGPAKLPSPEDCVYVHLAADDGVRIPYFGWFEAKVLSVTSNAGIAVLSWSCDSVNYGQESEVNLFDALWLPCVTDDVLSVHNCTCPRSWLEMATASVLPGSGLPQSSQVFFSRWWMELRWGFVGFCVTPVNVIETLRDLQESRRFIAGAIDDEVFWARVNSGSCDLSDVPQALLEAIIEARALGAQHFFPQGLFVARSRVDKSRLGLHVLCLMFPAELIGVLNTAGEWSSGGRRTELQHQQHQQQPQNPRPNSAPNTQQVAVRVGVAAQSLSNVRWSVDSRTPPYPAGAAVSEPTSCNANNLRARQRRRVEVARDSSHGVGREPLAYLASPQSRGLANCDVSLVPNKPEPTQAVLVTRQPLLPMTELFAIRGESAGILGEPDLFCELSVRPFGYH